MFARLFTVCFVAASLTAQALPPTAIPVEIETSERLAGADAELREQLISSVEKVLDFVAALPPKTDNIFSWKGEKKILEGKDLKIILTLSDDPIFQAASLVPGGKSPGTDGLTYLGYRPKDKTYAMGTMLIVDRIYFDEKMQPRKDATTRLLTVLAHELYGNVQNILSTEIEKFQGMTLAARKAAEVKSFEASIAYLKRLQKSAIYDKLDKDMQNDIQTALVREEDMLADWKK